MTIVSDASLQATMGQDIARKMEMDAMQKRIAPGPTQDKKMKEACEGFEAVFIGQMLKEMRKSVPKDGFLHGSQEDQYVSMFDEELSKTLAKGGGMGLATFMRSQMDAREKAKNPPAPGQGTLSGVRHTALDRMPVGKTPAKTQNVVQAVDKPAQTDPAAQAQAKSDPAAALQAKAAGAQAALAGTPSQKLNLPGADYLQGADKGLAAAQTAMVTPVEGDITSDFGWRRDPFTHQKAWHNGVDIAAPEGTPIKACKDGTVTFSGYRHGYGNLVIVEHADQTSSYYGHNSANAVTEGQTVRAGQQIAKVGQTGRATGAHLHFEIRRDGVSVDPVKAGGAVLTAEQTTDRLIPDL